jgi:hypothetical protein
MSDSHYFRDKSEALVEQSRITAVYDKSYIETRYDAYPTTRAMSHLRLGLVLHLINNDDYISVCDFGCGNGSFLSAFADFKACNGGFMAYGIEIADYPLPVPIERVDDPVPCDLFTCFDSLEHVENPRELLAKVQSPYICISLPWCHERTLGFEWFMQWKHRRPGEHLWHFDHISLPALLSEFGYKLIYCGNPEDEIRKGDGKLPNILTCLFQKA